MKFKAVLLDQKSLLTVCHSAKAFSRRCIFKLHREKLRFITNTGMTDGSQVWAVCATDALFGDLRLESTNDNTIYIAILDITQFINALKCTDQRGSSYVTMKLAKCDNQPVLRITVAPSAAALQDVSHDIAIQVLNDTEIQSISAPSVAPSLVIQILLPKFADLITFLEKAKTNSCQSVTFSAVKVSRADDAAADGAIMSVAKLLIVSSSLSISFALEYPTVDVIEDASSPSSLVSSEVSVDLKKLQKVLAVRELWSARLVIHIAHNQALIVTAATSNETSVIFYVPALLR